MFRCQRRIPHHAGGHSTLLDTFRTQNQQSVFTSILQIILHLFRTDRIDVICLTQFNKLNAYQGCKIIQEHRDSPASDPCQERGGEADCCLNPLQTAGPEWVYNASGACPGISKPPGSPLYIDGATSQLFQCPEIRKIHVGNIALLNKNALIKSGTLMLQSKFNSKK